MIIAPRVQVDARSRTSAPAGPVPSAAATRASAALQTRLYAIAGGSRAIDFAHKIRPWLGKEAALALLSTPSAGTEAAFVSHYLALGPDTSVRVAIDAAHSRSSSLQADPVYQRAAAGEPADRVVDVYAS